MSTGGSAGTSGGVDTRNNADDINDNDRNEQFLRKLRHQNELRRQRLRETLSEYDQELKIWKEGDSPKFNLARPPLEEHFIALEVEWELLQETKDQTFEKSLVNIASIFPDFQQQSDRPSDAVVQHCLLHEFSEEVIDSYHDLAETHATISKVLERETAKLELKRTFLQQQQKLLAELQEQLQHYKQKEEKEERESSNNNKTAQDQEDQVSRLKQQHEWIRQELHYVTQKLLSTMENSDNDQPMMQVDKASKSKTRKRAKRGTSQQQSEQDKNNTATSAPPNNDAMEEIIYQLLQRLLEDPSNPYMSVGEDSNTNAVATATANNNQEKRDRRRKEIINLLIECGVVLPHGDDNEGWVRLTDYQS